MGYRIAALDHADAFDPSLVFALERDFARVAPYFDDRPNGQDLDTDRAFG